MSPAPCLVVSEASDEKGALLPPKRGTFLGLIEDRHGELCCVVALEGSGMMLYLLHPSRVTLEGCVCG